MKLSRISVSIIGFALAATLAACGGGGGGGSVSPPGSNGGPGPTTAPTNSPTNPPTNPPATNPPSTPPPPVTTSSTVYNAYDGAGHTWGKDPWQTNGVTNAGDPGDGDTANGGTGSNSFGGVSCALGSESQMSSNNYHVHAFVGIYVNGNAFAIPDAIGLMNPTSDEPVTGFSCAYTIHTHSASGIIHIEDPTIVGSFSNTAPPTKFSLQALADVWGQSLSGLAGGTGLPAIYVGTPGATKYNGSEDLVNSYALSTQSPSSILLAHHVAIWLVYGTPPATGLPQVAFGISN